MLNTSAHADPSTTPMFGKSKIQPDIGLYAPGCRPRPDESRTQASKAELFAEFKIDAKDEPFREESGPFLLAKHSKSPHHLETFELPPLERFSKKSRDTRGQLTVYNNAIQASQPRTRVFSFFIRRQFCRLLCHSRTGTQVTPLFDYTKIDHLHTFLWRLTHANAADRGHDDSLKQISRRDQSDLPKQARSALGITPSDPLYQLSVAAQSGDMQLFISVPFSTTHIYPVGRGTRCFKAYVPNRQSLVLLKDTWRVEQYGEEHGIYCVLKEKGVRNIPNVLAAGDVPGRFQETPNDGAAENDRRLIHYRLVLDVVGKPLNTFESTHQLVSVLRDAFQGG